jgi:hypothetical protein
MIIIIWRINAQNEVMTRVIFASLPILSTNGAKKWTRNKCALFLIISMVCPSYCKIFMTNT